LATVPFDRQAGRLAANYRENLNNKHKQRKSCDLSVRYGPSKYCASFQHFGGELERTSTGHACTAASIITGVNYVQNWPAFRPGISCGGRGGRRRPAARTGIMNLRPSHHSVARTAVQTSNDGRSSVFTTATRMRRGGGGETGRECDLDAHRTLAGAVSESRASERTIYCAHCTRQSRRNTVATPAHGDICRLTPT